MQAKHDCKNKKFANTCYNKVTTPHNEQNEIHSKFKQFKMQFTTAAIRTRKPSAYVQDIPQGYPLKYTTRQLSENWHRRSKLPAQKANIAAHSQTTLRTVGELINSLRKDFVHYL